MGGRFSWDERKRCGQIPNYKFLKIWIRTHRVIINNKQLLRRNNNWRTTVVDDHRHHIIKRAWHLSMVLKLNICLLLYERMYLTLVGEQQELWNQELWSRRNFRSSNYWRQPWYECATDTLQSRIEKWITTIVVSFSDFPNQFRFSIS